MEKQYTVRISIDGGTVDGVYRDYGGTYDELHSIDWNKKVTDFVDDIKGYEDEAQETL